MAGVTIDSGPLDPEAPSYQTPREQWPELVDLRAKFIKLKFGNDCRKIVEWIQESDQMWRHLGYEDLTDLLRRGLKVNPDDIYLVVQWLEKYQPDEPISLPEALSRATYAKKGLRDGPGAPEGTVNNPQGIGGKSGKQIDNCYAHNNYQSDDKPARGTSADYWLARLERDSPEHFHEYQAGNYPNVAAACYDAGIREKKRRLCISDDPKAAGRYLAERVDRQWFETLIDAYYKSLEKEPMNA